MVIMAESRKRQAFTRFEASHVLLLVALEINTTGVGTGVQGCYMYTWERQPWPALIILIKDGVGGARPPQQQS